MPPLTPRTMRAIAPLSRALAASVTGPGSCSALDRLGGDQTLVDLTERDRHRLLVDLAVDQRADVLEQALLELGVVGVDLAGALGRVDDQGVLGVGLGEQVVDRRGGGCRRGGGGCRNRGGHLFCEMEFLVNGGA